MRIYSKEIIQEAHRRTDRYHTENRPKNSKIKNFVNKFFVVLALLCCSTVLHTTAQSPSTQGKDFWLTFGQIGGYSDNDTELQLIISAETTTDVTLKFTDLNVQLDTTINAMQSVTLRLNATQRNALYNNIAYNNSGSQAGVSKKSLHITSTENIRVVAANMLRGSTTATSVMPTDAWGTDYYHTSYKPYSSDGSAPEFPYGHDGYAIIAREANTRVYAGGTVHILNAGEVYSYYDSASVDLTGLRVTTSKPAAYFVMNNSIRVPYTGLYSNSTMQHLTPVRQWGKKFLVPNTFQKRARVRVMASESNTNISVSGSFPQHGALWPIQTSAATPTRIITTGTLDQCNGCTVSYPASDPFSPPIQPNITVTANGGQDTLKGLSCGQWVEFEIDSTGCYIEANKAVAVTLYMMSSSEVLAPYTSPTVPVNNTNKGDASMSRVASIEHRMHNVILSPVFSNKGFVQGSAESRLEDHFVVLMVETGDKAVVKLYKNNTEESGFASSLKWNDINGYSWAQYHFPVTLLHFDSLATYRLDAPKGLVTMNYGTGTGESYSYISGTTANAINIITDTIKGVDTVCYTPGITIPIPNDFIPAAKQTEIKANVDSMRWYVFEANEFTPYTGVGTLADNAIFAPVFTTEPNDVGKTLFFKLLTYYCHDSNPHTEAIYEAFVDLCACPSPPKITLKQPTAAICGTDAYTLGDNTFIHADTVFIQIYNNTGQGTLKGTFTRDTVTVSPFSFTYKPAISDTGKVVTIMFRTNNPLAAQNSQCKADTAYFNLTVNALPTLTRSDTVRACKGNDLDLMSFIKSNGTVHIYTDRAGTHEITNSLPDLIPVDTTTYYIKAVNTTTNCELWDSITVAPCSIASVWRWWYISSPYADGNPSAFDRPINTLGSKTGNMLGYYEEPHKDYTNPFTLPQAHFMAGRGIVASLDTNIVAFNPPDTATFKRDGYGRVPNAGNITIHIDSTFNMNNQPEKAGKNLLGNPYPTYISFDAFYADHDTLIRSTLWIRGLDKSDASSANWKMKFDTYNVLSNVGTGTINGTLLNGKIPPVQGFWVHAKRSSTVTFKEAHKTAADSSQSLRAPQANVSKTARIKVVSTGSLSDETVIVFHPAAANGYDNYDSDKMSNEDKDIPELYTKVGAHELVINGMQPSQSEIYLPLGFRTGKAGNSFNISATFENWGGAQVVLRDNSTGVETDLTASTYSFTSNIYNNTARFTLKISGSATAVNTVTNYELKITGENGKLTVYNANIGDKIEVFNAIGQKLHEQKLHSPFSILNCQLSAGVYLVKVGNMTERIIIK